MKTKDYIQIAAATVVAALFIKLFVLDAVVVSSPSMERTLMVGDLVLVNKLVDTRGPRKVETLGAEVSIPHLPFLGTLTRGDVIVFKFPGERDDDPPKSSIEFVKRCAALAGDTVQVHRGQLFVNGVRVEEFGGPDAPKFPADFADERLFPKGTKQNLDFYGPVIVPKQGDVIRLHERTLPEYEKLIRNEGHALTYGPQGYMIDGVATSRYIVTQNYLFVLGDNNYESSDSRFWGFVPEQNVTGRATLIYWSREPRHARGGALTDFLSSIRWDRVGAFVR